MELAAEEGQNSPKILAELRRSGRGTGRPSAEVGRGAGDGRVGLARLQERESVVLRVVRPRGVRVRHVGLRAGSRDQFLVLRSVVPAAQRPAVALFRGLSNRLFPFRPLQPPELQSSSSGGIVVR